jgi:hypothetical protein
MSDAKRVSMIKARISYVILSRCVLNTPTMHVMARMYTACAYVLVDALASDVNYLRFTISRLDVRIPTVKANNA